MKERANKLKIPFFLSAEMTAAAQKLSILRKRPVLMSNSLTGNHNRLRPSNNWNCLGRH